MNRTALFLILASALIAFPPAVMAQDATPVAADNSSVNVRDREAGATIAAQQSNTKDDISLTRRIRQAVVHDHTLSRLAHNVKIVSANGNVTLRGPVKTEEEKTAIASKAEAIAGPNNVDDELEVKGE